MTRLQKFFCRLVIFSAETGISTAIYWLRGIELSLTKSLVVLLMLALASTVATDLINKSYFKRK
jgi:hypothetical protein